MSKSSDRKPAGRESLENNDCGEGLVCYFAQPFRSGGKYPTGVERRNGLKIKPGSSEPGGQNNIEINPVIRGMVRRRVPMG